MDAIDKIMQRLGKEYAEETTAGKYKAVELGAETGILNPTEKTS